MADPFLAPHPSTLSQRAWFPLVSGIALGLLLLVSLAALGIHEPSQNDQSGSQGPAVTAPADVNGGENSAKEGQEGGESSAKDRQEKGALGTVYEAANAVVILGVAATGPLLLFRRTRRTWTRRTHRVVGWSLVGLFAIDLIAITGPAGLQNVIEAINLALVAVLAITSLLLFARPRRVMKAAYWPVRNLHVMTAMVYIVKFLGEPLLGGKIG